MNRYHISRGIYEVYTVWVEACDEGDALAIAHATPASYWELTTTRQHDEYFYQIEDIEEVDE